MLVVPGRLELRTGGYIYDRRIVEGLRAKGWTVRVHSLDESFPRPTTSALAQASDGLRGHSCGHDHRDRQSGVWRDAGHRRTSPLAAPHRGAGAPAARRGCRNREGRCRVDLRRPSAARSHVPHEWLSPGAPPCRSSASTGCRLHDWSSSSRAPIRRQWRQDRAASPCSCCRWRRSIQARGTKICWRRWRRCRRATGN